MNITLPPEQLAGLAEAYKASVIAANAIGTEVKAARAKPDEAIAAILDASTDPQVVAWREKDAAGRAKIAAAQAQLDANREAAKAFAATLLPSASIDVEARTKAFVAARAEANTLGKALASLSGGPEGLKALQEAHGIVEIVSLGREATGANAKGASGVRRPRISAATIDGAPVADSNGEVSFSLLASTLGVDGDAIRAAAFTSAGTDDFSTLAPGTIVTFPVTVRDTTHEVVVTAKGKPAPKVKAPKGAKAEPESAPEAETTE